MLAISAALSSELSCRMQSAPTHKYLWNVELGTDNGGVLERWRQLFPRND